MNELSWLYGKPNATGTIKASAADFCVVEDLGFAPSGDGEHLLVRVRKTGENTAWVAEQLAKALDISRQSVTWAGLKDRHAVTEQWFGIHLPGLNGRELPDLSAAATPSIEILEVARHNRKLRIGALKGNHFTLWLRNIETHGDDLEARLALIKTHGVTNYIGEQRFGREGKNLEEAAAMFAGKRIKDRNKRSLYLSAARSFLFNNVVSQRIDAGLARQVLAGDCLMLSGSHSFFSEAEVTPELEARLASGDLQLTAPLWGRGELNSQGAAAEFEIKALSDYQSWREGLEEAGMKQERRALTLLPEDMSWEFVNGDLKLSFALPAGAFATTVVRELMQASEPVREYKSSSDEHSGQ